MPKPAPAPDVLSLVLTLCGKRVLLDSDLARLYGVPTKRLNEQVRRNADKFPDDFAFQLTREEVTNLKSQIATSSWTTHGGRRKLPLVFTEYGAIMAANVLRSNRAISVSIEVVRVFIRLREMMISHRDLKRRLNELENKYDTRFRVVFDAIRRMMNPPIPSKRRIGF
jgi:hypothetical protein